MRIATSFGCPRRGSASSPSTAPGGARIWRLFLFTRAILAGEKIKVFNRGDMSRDFTYIDDIVEGVLRTLDQIPTPDPTWTSDAPNPGSSAAPYRIYNIGNGNPSPLMEMIRPAR